MFTSDLHRHQVQRQMKLHKLKAQLFQEEMKEMRWTPDLSKTQRYNNTVAKETVDMRRHKAEIKHKEKLDYNKQEMLKMLQIRKDGCTFSPEINKSSKQLKRNFSSLITPYQKNKQLSQANLFYL